jgi:hypothetical protein
MEWVEGSESTWLGQILRHGRQKAAFYVKKRAAPRANSKKKLAGGFF